MIRNVLALSLLVVPYANETRAAAAEPELVKTNLFEARMDGYFTYRIPGIVVTTRGSVLAYCEARQNGRGDWDNIDVMLRRSTDGGKTWEPRKLLADEGDGPIGNPTAIVDRQTQAVHFLYCFNYERCFYMRSNDDGVHFSKPVEITKTLEAFRPEYDWNVIATGPGHGIQLRGGRLLVPVWLSTGGRRHRPSVVSVIYSDDHGSTWKRGQIVPDVMKNMSETVPVELEDGRVLLNIRNEAPEHRRAIVTSPTGIGDWSKPVFHDALVEPICMGSIVRLSARPAHRKSRILFANPENLEGSEKRKGGNADRENVTIKMSYDEGETWPVSKVLEPGISAYSDLAVAPDGTVYCLYERGGVNNVMWDTQFICVARFNLV